MAPRRDRMVLAVGRGSLVKLEIFNLHSFNRVGYTRETLFEIVGITDGAGNPFGPQPIESGLKRYQDLPSALTLWMPNEVKHDLVLCEGGAFAALCNSAEQDLLSAEVQRFPFTDLKTFEMSWSSMIELYSDHVDPIFFLAEKNKGPPSYICYEVLTSLVCCKKGVWYAIFRALVVLSSPPKFG